VTAGRRPRVLPETPLDLWVAGHVNIDHLLAVARLPAPDRTVPASAHAVRLGGTAGNIARAAAGWGVRTGLIARVGEDFPAPFTQRLQAEGVDLRGVDTVAGISSPACFIAEDGHGGQSTIIDQGPMANGGSWRLPLGLLGDAPWIHLTTGPPAELLELKAAARSRGLRVAVDPAQEIHYRWSPIRLRELLDGAELLFANQAEVRKIQQLAGVAAPVDLLRWVGAVIITLGPRGAQAVTRSGEVRVAAPRPRRVTQVTGAGDAFRGGFYAGWFAGAPLRESLVAGVRSARAWIETGGPAPRRRGRS
jgi:sugar/nucleoside kinase (ribokinase family)